MSEKCFTDGELDTLWKIGDGLDTTVLADDTDDKYTIGKSIKDLVDSVRTEREARTTDLAFYREMIAKHAAEVPKMAERVFEAMSPWCDCEETYNKEKYCGRFNPIIRCIFTTCPLDGIKLIREGFEGP